MYCKSDGGLNHNKIQQADDVVVKSYNHSKSYAKFTDSSSRTSTRSIEELEAGDPSNMLNITSDSIEVMCSYAVVVGFLNVSIISPYTQRSSVITYMLQREPDRKTLFHDHNSAASNFSTRAATSSWYVLPRI